MFSFLKKLFSKTDKKPQETPPQALTDSQIRYNRLWERYAAGDWDDPIFFLCDYSSQINGEGHECFFDNVGERADEYDFALRRVLPPDLYENFSKAYRAVNSGKRIAAACNEADVYFYEHERQVDELLQDYADRLPL